MSPPGAATEDPSRSYGGRRGGWRADFPHGGLGLLRRRDPPGGLVGHGGPVTSPLTAGAAPRGPHPGPRTPSNRGCALLLAGPAGGGKAVIAAATADRLAAEGHQVEVLAGEEVRAYLHGPSAGSAPAEQEQLLRLAFVAYLLARQGVKAFYPVCFPLGEGEERIRDLHGRGGVALLEVYVDPHLAVDAADRPEAGADLPAAPPAAPAFPNLTVAAGDTEVLQAVAALHQALVERDLA